jgi:hypothetical protein
MRRYRDGLATTLAGAAIPYGYALVVWATGSLVLERHGSPDVWNIVGFAAGAAVGYAILRVPARHGEVFRAAGIARRGMIRGGAIHAVSIGVGIAAAAGLAHLSSAAAWPLAPLVSTALYLAGTSLNEAREIDAGNAS